LNFILNTCQVRKIPKARRSGSCARGSEKPAELNAKIMPQLFPIKKAILLLCCCFVAAASAQADTATAQIPAWKALHYRLSLLFVSAEAAVHIRHPELSEISSGLINPPGLSVIKPDKDVYELLIETDNLGRRSDTRIWYTADFRMLQMSRFDSGKRHRRKIFRYLDDGFWSFQRSPKNDNEIKNESQWSVEETKIVRKPEDLKSTAVIEDSLLFHLVSQLSLRKTGDNYTYYSYINDGVFQNQLQVVGRRDLEVDYVEKFPAGDKWVEGEKEVVHIRVRSRALDAKNQDDFEIMGLKGDLSLYVDAKSGLLVQLSGDVDYLGRVDIVLVKAEF